MMRMRMRMRMMEDIFSSYCKYLSANADPCTADNSITHHTFHINIPPEHKYFRPPFYWWNSAIHRPLLYRKPQDLHDVIDV